MLNRMLGMGPYDNQSCLLRLGPTLMTTGVESRGGGAGVAGAEGREDAVSDSLIVHGHAGDQSLFQTLCWAS